MTRILAVTLAYRRIGPAIKTWYEAQRHLTETRPDVRLDWLHMVGNPPGLSDGHDIVTAKYEEARRLFLAGEWDVFIAIEDDMFIPVDTFPRLLALLDNGADVGYGLYVWRHGFPRWSAYMAIAETGGQSLSMWPDMARSLWGKTGQVVGVGMGCTAIKRHALEAIPFERRGLACNDWYFAVDALKAGYKQVCDFGLVCGHYSDKPTPRILWPDPDDPDLFRMEYLAPPPEIEQRAHDLMMAQRAAAAQAAGAVDEQGAAD